MMAMTTGTASNLTLRDFMLNVRRTVKQLFGW